VAAAPRYPHILGAGLCNGIQNQFSGFQITIAVFPFVTLLYFMLIIVMYFLCLKMEQGTYFSWVFTVAAVPFPPMSHEAFVLSTMLFFRNVTPPPHLLVRDCCK
jgi:hypothetical protein